ncbi:amidohydrolase family protein [Herbiconiux sp. CPCC 205763]|uniref:Amidohydrolase family protein n=1 Tax=Herbiconiux aconitum TaxID=2970913 RepID=A0ABT2GQF2_9MICO|nr:amidohydrolase family protein [Herbiconiux aconitum]MCS5717169.1 amidohydrolase family protein [Herbiconiux aconitum]
MFIRARRLVDGAGHDGPGWLQVADGVIVAGGDGGVPTAGEHDGVLDLETVMPGFIDTHVHGAMGAEFSALGTDPAPAIEHHAHTGSTTVVASLATGERTTTIERMRELAPLVRAGALAGLHLEGPFLSVERRGAHNPLLLREPAAGSVDELLDAADGTLLMVTLAPELPGALEAIARLRAAGVTVAIGHTAASADRVREAVDTGATVVTHLFNGMPPLHHRAPGPVGIALTDERLVVELIGDGRHVDDEAIDVARRAASARYVLVSDAMAATGLGDGRYRLAGSEVVVSEGAAMLADGSSLAGSSTPVAGAVSRLLRRGVDLPEIVAATNTVPARSLGLAPRALVPGATADLLELAGSRVARVMRRGTWLASS